MLGRHLLIKCLYQSEIVVVAKITAPRSVQADLCPRDGYC